MGLCAICVALTGFVVDELRSYLTATAHHNERTLPTDPGFGTTDANNDLVVQQKFDSVDHPAVASTKSDWLIVVNVLLTTQVTFCF